jgi:hypothetical protein
MTRRRILTGLLALALASAAIVPASAQLFGGIVYDPTNYANARAPVRATATAAGATHHHV